MATARSARRAAESGDKRDVGGESPDAVVHDTDRQTEDLAVGCGLQGMITEAAVRLAHPLDADLGMSAAQLLALESAASLSARSGSARNLSSSWGMIVSVMR